MMNKEIKDKLDEMNENSLLNLLSIFKKGKPYIFINWDEYDELEMLSNINSNDKDNIKVLEQVLERFYEIVYTMRHKHG